MKSKEFIRYRDGDHVSTRVQDNIESFAKSVNESDIIKGRLIEGVKVNTMEVTRVYHGLDRRYKGWLIVDIDKPAVLFRDTKYDEDATKFISIRSTVGPLTCSIWVF